MTRGHEPSADGSSGASRLPDPAVPGDAVPEAALPEGAVPAPDHAGPSAEARPSADARPETVRPGDQDLPWKATAERRDLWGPKAPDENRALEGTVRSPASRALDRPRGHSPLLRFGVPLLVGGIAGVATLVLGLGTGIVGPLLALVAAAGVGIVAGSGTGAAVRLLPEKESADRPVLDTSLHGGTREVLQRILDANASTRERLVSLRPAASAAPAAKLLTDVETLLERIDALVGSEQVQSLRPSAGEVTMLEGMATRYVPDLVDSAADIIGFLRTFAGTAREEALANLTAIDQQLGVLGEGVERIERDVVGGVSHSLEVHAEFLRARFADQHLNPIIDV